MRRCLLNTPVNESYIIWIGLKNTILQPFLKLKKNLIRPRAQDAHHTISMFWEMLKIKHVTATTPGALHMLRGKQNVSQYVTPKRHLSRYYLLFRILSLPPLTIYATTVLVLSHNDTGSVLLYRASASHHRWIKFIPVLNKNPHVCIIYF